MKLTFIKSIGFAALSLALLFTSCDDAAELDYSLTTGIPSGGQSDVGDREEDEVYDLDSFTTATDMIELSIPEGITLDADGNADLFINDEFSLILTIAEDSSLPAADSGEWFYDSTNHDNVSVNQYGLVIAGNQGLETISVTYIDYDTETIYTASVGVSVEIIKITSITITGGDTVFADGETLQLSYTVTPENATFPTGVAWSLDDESKAWVADVNADGLVTGYYASTGEEPKVILTATDGSGVADTLNLIVSQNTNLYFACRIDGDDDLTEVDLEYYSGGSSSLLVTQNEHHSFKAELSEGLEEYFTLDSLYNSALNTITFTLTAQTRNREDNNWTSRTDDDDRAIKGSVLFTIYHDRTGNGDLYVRGTYEIPVTQRYFKAYEIGDYFADDEAVLFDEGFDEASDVAYYKLGKVSAQKSTAFASKSTIESIGEGSNEDGAANCAAFLLTSDYLDGSVTYSAISKAALYGTGWYIGALYEVNKYLSQLISGYPVYETALEYGGTGVLSMANLEGSTGAGQAVHWTSTPGTNPTTQMKSARRSTATSNVNNAYSSTQGVNGSIWMVGIKTIYYE